MPFCSQCGNGVDAADLYCARCGAPQPPPGGTPPRPPQAAEPFSSITPRTASILCYIPGIGWIASIIVLAAERFRTDRTVRFHAFQGLYLFVAWLIEDWVLRPLFMSMPHVHFDGVVKLLLLFLSIFMITKASQGETYSLPIIGELAAKSVSER